MRWTPSCGVRIGFPREYEMKKIVAVVVILLLVLVVAPWGIGRVAEKRLDAGLDQLVERAPYLKVVDRQWTGGWFRSEQVVTFEVFGDMFRAIEALEKSKPTEAPAVDADVAEPIEQTPPVGKASKATKAGAAAARKAAAEEAAAAAAEKAAEEEAA